MKTVPLYGKKAADRVAVVDDDDYAFVMLYRWNVWELHRPGLRKGGPYAVMSYVREDGTRKSKGMHALIMGATGIDHADHDGLNNQRYNLRRATRGENNYNTRPHLGARSPYKGVRWVPERCMWAAAIKANGRKRELGSFVSETEAACAYDSAARGAFGAFAFLNFPEGPTRAMQDQWQAERAERRVTGELARARSVSASWEHRVRRSGNCEHCGTEFHSNTHNARYCSKKCKNRADYLRKLERRQTLPVMPNSQQTVLALGLP